MSDVIGQEIIKQKLISSVKAGRIAHAQLFFGPNGCGSLPLAIAYAQYVSCTARKDHDSCGVCPSCLKYSKLVHPDLHFVFPVNTTKKIIKDPVSDDFIAEWREFVLQQPYFEPASWFDFIDIENKQGIISRKDSESVIRKLNLKSFESDYKFMIIWLPEKMNAASGNVLLKLLEEPPEKTVFLLISDDPDQVLITISSRTQHIKLSRLEDKAIEAFLVSTYSLTEEECRSILRLANGSVIRAMNAVQTSDENKLFLDRFIALMRLSWTREYIELNSWVDEMSGLGREKLKSFFEYSLRLVRENFITHLGKPELVYMTKEENDFAIKFHNYLNGINVIPVYNEMNKASADIERNGYARLILFDFSLKLIKLIRQT